MACEPGRGFVEEQLNLKRNAMAIYQDLVDVHGFTTATTCVGAERKLSHF
ncbi:hypothetical protein GCM10028796_05880 [Ramlibacter monticola]|uniref:Uncharacterized protein n=1 Tax=Ramlibacter monticola TaxID=1926872 RepID=A0A936YYY1_9BURK|nr:hypothetical protein [Ramlibacter monticola]